MSTITLLIILVIAAAAFYLLPLDPVVKKIVYFVLFVCAFIWLLSTVGVLPSQVQLR